MSVDYLWACELLFDVIIFCQKNDIVIDIAVWEIYEKPIRIIDNHVIEKKQVVIYIYIYSCHILTNRAKLSCTIQCDNDIIYIVWSESVLEFLR